MTGLTKLAADYNLYFGSLNGTSKNGVDKSTLEKLAKDAAREYLKQEVPLNSAIQKIASENSNLNNNHLRRISEMANNEVYDYLFKNATDKNIQFDVADPDSFLGKTEVIEKVASYDNSAYYTPPKRHKPLQKMAFFLEAEEVIPQGLHANPRQDLFDLQEKLQATKEHFLTEKLANSFNMQNKYAQLYKEVKAQVPQIGFNKVAQVLGTVSKELDVLEDLTYDLLKQKVASFEDLNKNFGRVQELGVNKEHPLIQNFLEYTKLANNKERINIALEEIEEDLKKTGAAIANSKKVK